MRLFHVETARGEAVAFSRQGHAQDRIVVLVYENGKPPLECRVSCWSQAADQLWLGMVELGLTGKVAA